MTTQPQPPTTTRTPAEIVNDLLDPVIVSWSWDGGDSYDVVIYIEGDYRHCWQVEEAVERWKATLRAGGLKVAE